MGRRDYDEVVLLTGYPSFAARAMLRELLRSPRTLVHAIVQPKFADEANVLLDSLEPSERSRVAPIEGDAAAMDLGLSGAEFNALAKEVDRIHHLAEVTYLGVERPAAEHVNIGGTREILEFAQACSALKCLVLHSTAHVAGDRTGLVREDELQADQSFRNVVEETKARAEKLARASASRGVPIAVVRPAIVIGDSISGEVDRLDGPYLLILLIVTSPPDFAVPLLGRGDLPLHLVPVDYVMRAARAIGQDPRAVGRTFHLADPAPLTGRRVFELVARAGGRREPRGSIPANLAKALLHTPGLERFAKSPRAFLDALMRPIAYDTTNTSEVLAGTGIDCPPFESYVDQVVAHVQHRVRERRAKKASVEMDDDPLV